jgi:hypothetical protein
VLVSLRVLVNGVIRGVSERLNMTTVLRDER